MRKLFKGSGFVFQMIFIMITGIASLINAQVVHTLEVHRFTHYRPDDWISYAYALYINSIDIDEDYIYFATQDGGILRYDKYRNYWAYPYTTSNGLRSNRVLEIVYNANDGNMYARTDKGIDVLRFADGYCKPASIKTMPQRRAPNLSELSEMNRKKKLRYPLYFRPPNSYLPDFFTSIYYNYHLDGTIYDRENREYKLTDRVTDQWQRVWFGTTGLGPARADLFTLTLDFLPQSISDISPRDKLLAGPHVWIGGMQNNGGTIGGIVHWDRDNDEWEYFEAPFISRLYDDRVRVIDSGAWFIAFGTEQGVAIYDLSKSTWKSLSVQAGLESDEINDLLVLDNRIFVATMYGFNWINLPDYTIREPEQRTLNNVRINQLAADEKNLWLATRQGLYRMNLEAMQPEFVPSRAAGGDLFIRALERIGDELWMANSSGVTVYDTQKNTWRSYTSLSKAFHFNDIHATDKAVWFATDEGLLKYETDDNYWRLFTERDGLLSNRVFHIDDEDGFLWLSTESGITIFNYDRPGQTD